MRGWDFCCAQGGSCSGLFRKALPLDFELPGHPRAEDCNEAMKGMRHSSSQTRDGAWASRQSHGTCTAPALELCTMLVRAEKSQLEDCSVNFPGPPLGWGSRVLVLRGLPLGERRP